VLRFEYGPESDVWSVVRQARVQGCVSSIVLGNAACGFDHGTVASYGLSESSVSPTCATTEQHHCMRCPWQGVIAYLLLTGHVPYDGPTEKAILLRILRDEGAGFDGPEWTHVSAEAKALVRMMMYRDAGLRPSAVQVGIYAYAAPQCARGVENRTLGSPHVFLRIPCGRNTSITVVMK
jgi:serine/threonine protein kinase